MNLRFTKNFVLAAAVTASMMSAGALAQDKPAAKPPADSASRWDIFLGYSYLAPKGTVQSQQSDGSVQPFDYSSVDYGGIVSGAYYFNKYVGAQIENRHPSRRKERCDLYGFGGLDFSLSDL